MLIYIAGKVTARHRLKDTREQVRALGHQVSSSWIDTATDYGKDDATPERLAWAAKVDFQETSECDLFIIDTLDESVTGGRETELGYLLYRREQAQAMNNGPTRHPVTVPMLWRVGPLRQLYHAFAQYEFNTWDELLTHLKNTYAGSSV